MLINSIKQSAKKYNIDELLPQEVRDIDLTKSLHAYNENQHLLSIAEQVNKHFEKRQKYPHTAEEMKAQNKWVEDGTRPEGLDYQLLDKKIRNGQPFDTHGWIPNDKIYTNVLHNRGDRINFANIQYHLNIRDGLFWPAMNITVVVYYEPTGGYKFVTVIGNHCTVKSILVSGLGEDVFARVISLGKNASLKDIAKHGAIIHHTDSDRRTNQGAEDRLVSGTHAGESLYVNTMKVLVDLGFNIKDQIKTNGQKRVSISSPQLLMQCIKQYTYPVVRDNVNLIRKLFPDEKKVLTGALSVLSTIRYYFGVKLNKISKEEFEKFMTEWSTMNSQSQIFGNSTTQKEVMYPVMDMIKSINKWAKTNLKRGNKLITSKDMVKAVPEKDLENVQINI